MRQLLAYASDSSDCSDYEIDNDPEVEQVSLMKTDWDVLAAIFARLDEPGGPSTFNTVDYNNACQSLGIGPSSLWLGVYRSVSELKLGKPIKWSSALQSYKKYQTDLQNRHTSSEMFRIAKLKIYFSQWRATSSLNNVLMAQCYAFEVNNLLVPTFSSWRQRAGPQRELIDDFSDLATQYSHQKALGILEGARTAVRGYRDCAESVYAQTQKRRALAAMKCAVSRLKVQISHQNRQIVVSAFMSWRCNTGYTREARTRQVATSKAVIEKIKVLLNTTAGDAKYSTLCERFNLLAPPLGTLHTKSKALQHSEHIARQSLIRSYFKQWKYCAGLEKQSQALKSQNKLQAQLRDARKCLTHWQSMTPLQTRAIEIKNEQLTHKAVMVWRLRLKGQLLKDSWGYRQIVQILRYWYLKCSAEVHLQYQEHTLLGVLFSVWKSRAELRWSENKQIVSQIYRPQLIADSLTRVLTKFKKRVELLNLDSKEANVLECQNSKTRGVTMFSAALDRVEALDLEAMAHYKRQTSLQAFQKWSRAAERRRIMLLEQSAERYRAKCTHQLKTRCFKYWYQRVEHLTSQVRLSDRAIQLECLNYWRETLSAYRVQVDKAQSIYEVQLKRTVLDIFRQKLPELTQKLEMRCTFIRDIHDLALEQALFRRMQIRLVRIRSQEAEAVRIHDMNSQDRRKRVLRHWYSRALEPQVEPMTPRSARRLPPTALRRIIQESRRRPGTPPGSRPGTPAGASTSSSPTQHTPSRTSSDRVNRKLFPDN